MAILKIELEVPDWSVEDLQDAVRFIDPDIDTEIDVKDILTYLFDGSMEITHVIMSQSMEDTNDSYVPCNHVKWPWNDPTSKWCSVLECDNYASKH